MIFLRKNKKKFSEEWALKSLLSGQVMILTTMIIGGIMISASVVAGILMFYQIRQANDAGTSGMAVFAADAGIEKALQCYFWEGTSDQNLNEICDVSDSLPNGASYEADLDCQMKNGSRYEKVSCESGNVVGFKVRSRGFAEKTERVLETFIFTKKN